jgi:hypothetical protein
MDAKACSSSVQDVRDDIGNLVGEHSAVRVA